MKQQIKKRLAFIPIISAMLLAVTACMEKPKTVDYFKQHPEEIQSTLDECKDKVINITADNTEARNCRAAELAKVSGYLKNLKDQVSKK